MSAPPSPPLCSPLSPLAPPLSSPLLPSLRQSPPPPSRHSPKAGTQLALPEAWSPCSWGQFRRQVIRWVVAMPFCRAVWGLLMEVRRVVRPLQPRFGMDVGRRAVGPGERRRRAGGSDLFTPTSMSYVPTCRWFVSDSDSDCTPRRGMFNLVLLCKWRVIIVDMTWC